MHHTQALGMFCAASSPGGRHAVLHAPPLKWLHPMRRPLWGLHRCMAVLEAATFACPANEQRLVALRMPEQAPALAYADQAAALDAAARSLPSSAPAAAAVPMESVIENGANGAAQSQAAARGMSASAPCTVSCSPPSGKGRLASMQGEPSHGGGQGKRQRLQLRSGGQARDSDAGSGGEAQQGTTFPAWLVTQVSSWHPLLLAHNMEVIKP